MAVVAGGDLEYNTVTLSGIIAGSEGVRQSPAGVPHQRVWLEHRSRQVEAGHPREVTLRLEVELRGHAVGRFAHLLVQGQRVLVEGFLDRSGHRDDGRRLVLHAQMITLPADTVG
jgi:primosomal replication protein N